MFAEYVALVTHTCGTSFVPPSFTRRRNKFTYKVMLLNFTESLHVSLDAAVVSYVYVILM